MPNINLAAAFREVDARDGCLNRMLAETFAEYRVLLENYSEEDLDENALAVLFCEKLQAQRTWYKVSGPYVTMDFGQ